MKRTIFAFVCIVSLFFIGCSSDSYFTANITIKNESSYNLHITIKNIPADNFVGENDYQFNVKRNESKYFYLRTGQKSKGGKNYDPNKVQMYINIFNSDTKALIKQLQNDHNLFEYIYSDSSVDFYVFKITDELLS